MNDVVISCENLTKRYGHKVVVDNVSLSVKKGSICGLVGRNGAGKTTLIRLLTGLVLPTSGTFEVCTGMERTSTTVAAIVERPSIFRDLTAMENLTAQSKLLGIPVDGNYLEKTLALVGLKPSFLLAKNFSLGMQQRLAVAMTLVGRPQVLILDEPTNGLDPQGIRDMRELFVRLNKELGTTIIISSHILSELSKFATDYFFMEKGKLLKTVTAEELQELGQKRLRINVDDVDKSYEVLSQLGKAVKGDGVVELFGEVPPTEALLALAKEGITATNIVSVGEDLENYFIELLGGAK